MGIFFLIRIGDSGNGGVAEKTTIEEREYRRKRSVGQNSEVDSGPAVQVGGRLELYLVISDLGRPLLHSTALPHLPVKFQLSIRVRANMVSLRNTNTIQRFLGESIIHRSVYLTGFQK